MTGLRIYIIVPLHHTTHQGADESPGCMLLVLDDKNFNIDHQDSPQPQAYQRIIIIQFHIKGCWGQKSLYFVW